jgi:aminoglycoside phosphotransferase family enzyme/predicted kinase
MSVSNANSVSSEDLVAALRSADAYPTDDDSPVKVHETHISWVFLTDRFAYKVKKPITTSFLDYGTLDKRESCCREEFRLDRRNAEDLYLGVVPITIDDGRISVEGQGEAVEFAVKMHRFPDDALLSDRLERGKLTSEEVFQLAGAVAGFHQQAARVDPRSPWGSPQLVFRTAADNLRDLAGRVDGDTARALHVLDQWTVDYFAQHKRLFAQRCSNGFIRECHGDLHLANVVHWQHQLIPFDGIEFNEEFRWIDVLSDAAFLGMDFAARGHLDLGRSFINAYLEQTGDHASLALLRWYLVYRAMVRAKVASIRAQQPGLAEADRAVARKDCADHIDLAFRFTVPEQLCLWITHGVSGSGKTTGSELVVQRHGAIRLRSDFERKRHFGLSPMHRPDPRTMAKLYCESAGNATYGRLHRLALGILRAGYSVVVDATFLKRQHRESFRQLAEDAGVDFAILDFHTNEQTLRQRVADRVASDSDASDADVQVLESQLRSLERLSDAEMERVVEIPDIVSAIDSL